MTVQIFWGLGGRWEPKVIWNMEEETGHLGEGKINHGVPF